MLTRSLLSTLLLASSLPARAVERSTSVPAIAAQPETSGAAWYGSPEHGKAATADASPVAPGSFEVELAYAPVWSGLGAGAGFTPASASSTHALTTTATFGVARDLDVKLSGMFAATYDAGHVHADGSAPNQGSGLGDLRLGGRWRFVESLERALELAVTGEAVIPVGTPHTATQIGLSQGYWSARLGLAGTKDVGRATFNAELACTLPVSGDARGISAVVQANVAAGYHLVAWAQPEVELNYQAVLGADSQVLATTAGVIIPWGAGHRVVAAVQHGLWGRNSVQTTGALLAYKAPF